MNDLPAMIARFSEQWGPLDQDNYHRFVDHLREVLEAYGEAALRHRSLPDTEHAHGDPI